jgi:predicted membrane channel-forming protein YqfA (hemolysin III family)
VVPVNDANPWRKLVGIVAILSFIVLWAVLVASLARFVGRWPILVQAPFYLVMGLIWIFPLKPLIRWSQTGVWSRERNE